MPLFNFGAGGGGASIDPFDPPSSGGGSDDDDDSGSSRKKKKKSSSSESSSSGPKKTLGVVRRTVNKSKKKTKDKKKRKKRRRSRSDDDDDYRKRKKRKKDKQKKAKELAKKHIPGVKEALESTETPEVKETGGGEDFDPDQDGEGTKPRSKTNSSKNKHEFGSEPALTSDSSSSKKRDSKNRKTNSDGTIGKQVEDALRVSDFRESDTGQRLSREFQQSNNPLERFDIATRAGLDFLLDNPRASVQDTTRGTIEDLTGVDDAGKAAAELASDVDRGTQEAIQGTALDNPVTDLAAAGLDIFVADPAKAAVRGATGIDLDTGETEGTVGAIDAFDVGVTVGTAGLGAAGVKAAKAATKTDEAGGLIGRLLGRGSRSTDEASRLAYPETVTRTADETAEIGTDTFGRVTIDGRTAGTGGFLAGVAGLGDEAAQAVTRSGDSLTSRIGSYLDELTGGVDEAAGLSDEGSRVIDDTAGLGDEGARLLDEGAQLVDEGAQAADDSPGIIRRITGSTTGKIVGTGGAILGGGALLDSLGTFDQLALTDPKTGEEFRLIKEKTYPPTETHPNGGVLWDVRRGSTSTGYTAILRVAGRNVYILGRDGSERRAQVPIDTFREAISPARGSGPSAGVA